MTDEATNPETGSDNVEPSTDLDNPANLNFEEPEEANQEAEADGIETERETDDTEDGEEAEPESAEPDETEEPEAEPEETEVDEDVLVTLPTGEQLKLDELKSGYMREKDYRHKTQELGNGRRDLEAMAQRVNGTIEAFSSYLASQLPEQPSPALSYSDPALYNQQKAVYDAAMGQVNAIIEMGQQASSASTELSETDLDNKLREENARLIEKMPALSEPARREEFNRQTLETARSFGFSDDELSQTTDHRILMLGHYARLGLEAEQAKAKVALKVKNAVPATPAAKRAKSQDNKSNRQALSRLTKSGSIYDAMDVRIVGDPD